jgi:hypothetical protein
MGDGLRSGQGTLRDPADYWLMGPGPKALRSRWQPIVPPRITVRQEPSVYNDRYFAYVEMVAMPSGGGALGAKLGPRKSHSMAYRAAEEFITGDHGRRWFERWCS